MHASKWPWVVTLSVALALVLPASAQAQFGADKKFLGVHVGLSGVGSAAALGVNGEIAYNERIGIGAWFDTWGYGETFGGTSWDVRYFAIAGTGAYHFPIESNPKIDPFLGLALGYFVVNTSVNGVGIGEYGGDASRLFVGGFGGARYFFSDTLTGVARLGFGASYLTVGLDFAI
jgi:hypothetical protein